MTPKFIYFDLGNVLLFFSHAKMCRQMAEVSGADEELVRHVLFDRGLEFAYEKGDISTAEFYERFCEAIDRRPPLEALTLAANDIFEVNVEMRPVLGGLLAAGKRLGLLSNTNEMHYNFFADGRYALIPDAFETVALSFRIKAMKPDPEIYKAAAEMAGVAPGEVFFADDVQGNVEGARDAGFDAVVFTGARQLAEDLWARGVRFNY
jgi:HAD superfamily hydrolase (TIGR01509 family)